MKVLFSGLYRQNDGWGKSSQDYLRALRLVPEIQLEAKPIVLAEQNIEKSNEWDDIEAANIGIPDIIIQHTLPFLLKPVPGAYNIALCHFETDNLTDRYAGKLSSMNEVWVSTSREVAVCKPINVNTHHIPMPLNLSSLENVEPFIDEYLQDQKMFLYSGSWSERKNLSSLIMAYWLEFNKDEKVKLFLKLNPENGRLTPESFVRWVDDLKKVFRIHQKITDYPEILSVVEYVEDHMMSRLQKRADCFIIPSYGESTCRPLVESLYLGVPTICTEGIHANENYLHTCPVKSYPIPCTIQMPPVPNIYTAHEVWHKIDVMELAYAMRRVITNPPSIYNKEEIKQYHDYTSVAQRISNQLSRLLVST